MTTTATKKAKSAYTAFPSGYTFETSEEEEAKRRRAQRFEREREIEESKNANQLKGFIPRQVVGHASSLDVTAGADGGGAVRVSQMGAGRSAGKWLGGRMGSMDTAVDPVSLDAATLINPPLTATNLTECDQLGSIHYSRDEY